MRMRLGDQRCGNWDRCGRVRANEITLSGGARCSGRGRVQGDTHGDANAHVLILEDEIRGMKRADHWGRWHGYENLFKSIFH